ncbi:hypothetical protein AB6A40_007112 [Gnathostoma spinigerum]|uniref:Uncharacterized protein n=1 Tax=Gnathostoma spinigerum TaxID=75299 RepID=A0ABD6EKJ7_9BILA
MKWVERQIMLEIHKLPKHDAENAVRRRAGSARKRQSVLMNELKQQRSQHTTGKETHSRSGKVKSCYSCAYGYEKILEKMRWNNTITMAITIMDLTSNQQPAAVMDLM